MTGTVKAIAVEKAPHSVNESILDVTIKLRDGVPWVVRTAQRFGGVAFSVAGLALLLFPFGAATTTEILCKLMMALVFGFVGAALWQSGSPASTPEMEIDLVRREIRLMRWVGRHRQETSRASFSDLGRAEIAGRVARLWDKTDGLVAELNLADERAVRSLQRALQDEGVPV